MDDLCAKCGIRHVATVDVNPGKGQNALVTVRTALDKCNTERTRGKIYDKIWCVLDVEHMAHEVTLTEAVALAKKNGIRLFLSNPSFEVWLITHFERVTRDFANGGAVETYLNERHWHKHFQCDYEKGDQHLYTKLADRLQSAMGNAQWGLETHHENRACRDCNASTEVYQLIQELLRLPTPL